MKYYRQVSIELDVVEKLSMIRDENKLPNISAVIEILIGEKKKHGK